MRRRKERPFELALATLTLTPTQKEVLTHRYLRLLDSMEMRAFRISILFNTSRIIVTVGSLIVPALLSIQYSQGTSSPEGISLQIYWGAWIISLFVTICNGLLTLFKLDKRYYYLHTVLEQLISEGWQYVELSGRFSGFYTPNVKATHENQFIFFCHIVEKIRMRQVQEEYFKLTDAHGSSGPAAVHPHGNQIVPVGASASAMQAQNPIDALIPPTPLRADLVAQLPPEVVTFLQRQSSLAQISGDGIASGASATAPNRASKTRPKGALAATEGTEAAETQNKKNQEDGASQAVSVLGDMSEAIP
jgi:hypothetical protein